MGKWLTIGGAVLLLFWAPFLYTELTSEPAEKKPRTGVDQELDDELALEAEMAELPPEPIAAEGEALTEELPPAEEGVEPAEPELPPEAEEGEGEDVPEPPPTEEGVEPELAEGEEASEALDEEGEQAPAAPAVALGPAAVLKSAFQVEGRDSFWAPDAEARIHEIFEGLEAPEDPLQSAECRKRVCRVEMSYSQDNAQVYTDAYSVIREEFGLEVGVEPVVGTPSEQEEGAPLQKVVLYLPREGYTIADMKE